MTTVKEKPEVNDVPLEADEPEEDTLDLTSLVPTRRLVKVPTKEHPEGEAFWLRLLDDFGIQQQQQLMADSRRFNALLNADKALRPAEQDKLKKLLDDMFDVILDAPVSVKKNMPDGVRSRVVSAFSWAPQLALQQAAAKEREKNILSILVEREMVSQEELDKVMTEVDSGSTSES